jgi:predicted acetyltransferase
MMNRIEIQSRTEEPGRSKLLVAAVNEEGLALSTGQFVLTESYYCGNPVKTMLAGGIATPVEHRRGGNVRKMFAYMHRAACEEGVALSLLHPFSFSYYNQFGYERVADHLILRCPTRTLDFLPRTCRLIPFEEEMLPEVLQVYHRFARGRNLLLKRSNEKHFVGKNRNTYVYFEGKEAAAYVTFTTAKTLHINNYRDTLLTVCEMAYASPQGLDAILSFLRMFEGEFEEIEFRDVNLYSELDLLLRHYTHTSYTRLPDLAARILNTETLLRANLYPQAPGAFTLRVLDDLPTVAGTFAVSYGAGACRVQRLEESAKAHVTLTAPALLRIMYGSDPLDAHTLQYLKGCSASGNAEALLAAFPKRPCGVFEHF